MNPRNRSLTALLVATLVFSTALHSGAAVRSPPVEVVPGLPAASLELGGPQPLRLRVQVAETREAQGRGLMEIDDIPENYGMVFLWTSPGRHAFHMKNTLMPLDIAWWNEEMRIVDIQTMTPCQTDPCQIYLPAYDHIAAVEVRGGLLSEKGVQAGDPVGFSWPERDFEDEPSQPEQPATPPVGQPGASERSSGSLEQTEKTLEPDRRLPEAGRRSGRPTGASVRGKSILATAGQKPKRGAVPQMGDSVTGAHAPIEPARSGKPVEGSFGDVPTNGSSGPWGQMGGSIKQLEPEATSEVGRIG